MLLASVNHVLQEDGRLPPSPIVRGPTDVGPICQMVIPELEGSYPDFSAHADRSGLLAW